MIQKLCKSALIVLILTVFTHEIHSREWSANAIQAGMSPLTGVPSQLQPKFSLEVAHGQAYVDWIDPWSWHFSGNLLYHFSRRFSAGLGTGFHFDSQGIYLRPAVVAVYGNKAESFAIGTDISVFYSKIIDRADIWPLMAVYYKNFFVKYMPTFLFYEKEQYFELGYSFILKTK